MLNTLETFGERLQTTRKEAGMSQMALADKLGMPRSTISGYETEGKEPPYAVLCKLADVLGVTADYLICRNNDRYATQESVLLGSLKELQKDYDKANLWTKQRIINMLDDVYTIIDYAIQNPGSQYMDACDDFIRAARRVIDLQRKQE